jgi:hypothetical protein
MCLQVGFVIFLRTDFGAKAAHKMLVKLTLVVGTKYASDRLGELMCQLLLTIFMNLPITELAFTTKQAVQTINQSIHEMSGSTKGGSITVLLTSCLTGLD